MKKSFGARTLVYPIPVWVIGTYDRDGKPNAATIAWGGVCSSIPPCVAVSLRKATKTHGSILERKAFTVNVPSVKFFREADYFGLVSGKNTDKFHVSGLTPVKGDKVDAPYIQEFPLILECRFLSSSEIGIHTHFIGEIMDVKADESVLGDDGLPDIKKINPVVYGPEIQSYHALGEYLGRAFNAGKVIRK
ncbi:MAG: flavin reductase family protein [Syntrophales bacterium]